MAANNQNWEKSEFPILCETCLGPNPYLRMQKLNHGAECKTCNRPFTVFRWNPNHQRAKKTEICQTCAKIKNVCQTCVLDLQFGLPVMVRDSILNVNEKLPSSDVNRQYFINKMDAQLGNESLIDYGKTDAAARELLSSISTRSEPYYARNKPHLCSFFQKGQCNRGDECPYRHENPHPDSETTSRQNIKDRFHGRKDVVAEKILNKVGLSAIPPVDRSITSLYISGVDEDMNEIDLRYFTFNLGIISQLLEI